MEADGDCCEEYSGTNALKTSLQFSEKKSWEAMIINSKFINEQLVRWQL
jgi:hypothetical protein